MTTAPVSVDEVDPVTAYRILEDTADAQLIDVRTRAEWSFVGLPDLSAAGKQAVPVEWVSFPDMTANDGFVGEICERLGGALPDHLLFICRSGQRSMAAARAVAETAAECGQTVRCSNVAEGFEGILDEQGHRGTRNGWKARGLPWRQN